MTPNSSSTSYLLPSEMYERYDTRLLCQLVSDNPFQQVIYSPYGPLVLAGTANFVQGQGTVTFSNPQSGITGSTFTVAGDSSGQTYIFQDGQTTSYNFYPVYGGSSVNGATVTVVPTDTLSTNNYFLTALSAASGKLESACLRSEIYSVPDLQALNGVSLQYLKELVANIAIMNLYRRRAGPSPSESVVQAYNDAVASLDDLANGKEIFAFAETEQAGLPATYSMQPMNQIQNRMVSSTWQRSFGVRQNMRYGFGYGGQGVQGYYPQQ